jgi:hypothetical protein
MGSDALLRALPPEPAPEAEAAPAPRPARTPELKGGEAAMLGPALELAGTGLTAVERERLVAALKLMVLGDAKLGKRDPDAAAAALAAALQTLCTCHAELLGGLEAGLRKAMVRRALAVATGEAGRARLRSTLSNSFVADLRDDRLAALNSSFAPLAEVLGVHELFASAAVLRQTQHAQKLRMITAAMHTRNRASRTSPSAARPPPPPADVAFSPANAASAEFRLRQLQQPAAAGVAAGGCGRQGIAT